MSLDNLLNKSRNNNATGEWAEKSKYYDVAVSRYYYSLFEKIIYIMKKRGVYTAPPNGQDSHKFTIDEFKRWSHPELSPEDIPSISQIGKLKKCRVDADYTENIILDPNEYNLIFKYYFKSIDEILENLL